MKKFSIKDLNIINKNEKINAIKLENKTEKYILYGSTNNTLEDNEFFSELKFKEELNITPKKKIQTLNLSIEKEGEFNFIKIKGNKVFYLKNNENVTLEKDDFKIYLGNGNLHNSSNIIKLDHKEQSKIKKSNNDNLVKNILLKNKKTTSDEQSSLKTQENTTAPEPVVTEVEKVQENTTVPEPVLTQVEKVQENTSAPEPVVTEVEKVQENTTVPEPTVTEVEKVQENTSAPEPVVTQVEKVQENTSAHEPVVTQVEKVQENTSAPEPVVTEVKENTTVPEPVVTEVQEKYVDFETFQKNIIQNNDLKINKNINKEITIKNENQELYSLDQILNDFNKYYLDEDNKSNNLIKKQISFFNKNYNINLLEIESSKLNMQNLFKSTVKPKNIINDLNISIKLSENNSSYIILYLKNPYLFNKIDSKLIITNLSNKKSIVLSDNQYFKLNKIDFYIVNNCSLLVPIVNKSMNNKFGQRINFFEPLI